MNRKLNFIVVIAVAALVALLLSASGVIAQAGAPQVGAPQAAADPAPLAPQCADNAQTARLRVVGQVFDEQGAARAGLRVQAIRPDGQSRAEALTQADEHFSFPALPAGSYTLRVLDQRGRPLPLIGDAELNAPENKPWMTRDLVLASAKPSANPQSVQATGIITGVVTASDTGLPLSSVSITAYDSATGDSVDYSYTDPDGKYTFDSLATGSYKVEFQPSSYGPAKNYLGQFYNNQTSLDTAIPIHVTDGQTTPNINAVLQPGGQITGRVTAADTHNPLPDVYVSVDSGGCAWYGYAYTDANGVYTVTAVPSGNNYIVDFDPSYSSSTLSREYLGQYYNNKSDYSSATPVVVVAPNIVNNIDAALLRGGKITGIVTAQGGSGLPDVQVTAEGDQYYTSAYVTTDATGAYTLTGLMSDTYKVEFSPSDSGVSKDYAYQYYSSKLTWSTANTVTVTAPNVTPNINQVLTLGGRITGRVTTADTATAIQYAGVTIYANDGNSVDYNLSTDASGVYTSSALPTGSYQVRFQPGSAYQMTYTLQYYNNKSSLTSADAVNVTAPNLVSNIDAALAHGGQISGTITAADTGLPLKSIHVSIYNSNGSSIASANSNAQGVYLTPALPAGDYRVRFSGTTTCSGQCYVSQYYNNKPSLATATVINVAVSQVTKNINAVLAVCATGPTPPSSVSIGGPVTGTAFSNVSFSAAVSPGSASIPITYTWQIAGQSPIKHTGGGISDSLNFVWITTGTKTLTVTATNAYGSAMNTRTIIIEPSTIVFNHQVYLPIVIR
jgi:hypothetical protein